VEREFDLSPAGKKSSAQDGGILTPIDESPLRSFLVKKTVDEIRDRNWVAHVMEGRLEAINRNSLPTRKAKRR